MNTISIIGAGNMGYAIAQGLVKSGHYSKAQIYLSTKDEKAAANLSAEGYNVDDNIAIVKASSLVILVVKPWQAEEVLTEIKPYITDEHMLASCVTGLSSEKFFEIVEKQITFFRVMPNTGAMVGESMSCISDTNANTSQKELIKSVFSTLGLVLFIEEDKMAAGTAIAGCGIAFALRFIRAATECGVEIGITAKDATIMSAQIAKGAAELILQNESNPEVEIDKVTTPGGVTIAGLNEMEHNGFSSSVMKGIKGSYNKAQG
jgi:pyrroline-5-carboxylate reductase